MERFVDTDQLPYGAAAKVESVDGDVSVADHVIKIRNSSEILVKINWSGDCVVGRKGNLLGIRMKNNSKLHIFQA